MPRECRQGAAIRTGSQVVRDWLITAPNIFVKHSVIETPDETLSDVTPRVGIDAQHPIDFIIWDSGNAEDFVRLPPQVIYVPPHWYQDSALSLLQESPVPELD